MTPTSYTLDTPGLISLEYLTRLDAEAPGTWLAQPKLDGWRRLMTRSSGTWRGVPRKGGTGDNSVPLPQHILAALEASPWLHGLDLDCEWVGRRQQNGEHRLYVFDVLTDEMFSTRYDTLSELPWPYWPTIQLVPCWGSKLVDHFLAQLADPLSEGLVLRRSDSRLIGGRNPLMLKVKHRRVSRG
jgi:ATP-dependent DNA ligase